MSQDLIKIPDQISTKQQLQEVLMEIDKILDEAVQGNIRKEQLGQNFAVTRPSRMLQALLELHQKQLTIETLEEMRRELKKVEQHAALVRVVLSAEPTPEVEAKIVSWFRTLTPSPVFMRFGIQPAIAGGCLVKTPNHHYDFSLRTKILKSQATIRQALDKVDG